MPPKKKVVTNKNKDNEQENQKVVSKTEEKGVHDKPQSGKADDILEAGQLLANASQLKHKNIHTNESSSYSDGSSIFAGINSENLPKSIINLVDRGSESAITMALKIRHSYSQPYFNISSSVLVACLNSVNFNSANIGHYGTADVENKPTNLFSDEMQKMYSSAYVEQDVGRNAPASNPHIYKMVTDAYIYMRRQKNNQLFILHGLTGSGKSKTESDILDQLGTVSSQNGLFITEPHKKLHLHTILMNSFGHACVFESRASTRYAVLKEVQFNKRGHIVGQKNIVFGFDRSRITDSGSNGYNFNIFYYLLYGGDNELLEKTYICRDHKAYPLLCRKKEDTEYSEALLSTWFEEIKAESKFKLKQTIDSMLGLGFSNQTILNIFQLIAAILNLSNLSFKDLVGIAEAAVVDNESTLNAVSKLLGVPSRRLETALTYKTIILGSEICTVYMSASGAKKQTNALIRILYQLVFLWIVDTVNKLTDSKTLENKIAILNMYGFQWRPSRIETTENSNGHMYSYEQLQVNILNEMVYCYMFQTVMSQDLGINAELQEEMIPTKHLPWMYRLDLLNLLCGGFEKEGDGIISIFENHTRDEEICYEDVQLYRKLYKNSRKKEGINIQRDKKTEKHVFEINHFMDTLSYDITGFCEKNIDQIVSTDFILLFQNSSSKQFVKTLFSTEFIHMFLHPENNTTILEAHITSNIRFNGNDIPKNSHSDDKKYQEGTQVPTEYNNHGDLHKYGGNSIIGFETAVDEVLPITPIGEACLALKNILASSKHYKCRHVIHIRSENPDKSHRYYEKGVQNKFFQSFVTYQVRAFGIADLSLKFEDFDFFACIEVEHFASRYKKLSKKYADLEPLLLMEKISGKYNWKTGVDYQVGRSKVFMTESIWQVLEMQLRAKEKTQKRSSHSKKRLKKSFLDLNLSFEGKMIDQTTKDIPKVNESEFFTDSEFGSEIENLYTRDLLAFGVQANSNNDTFNHLDIDEHDYFDSMFEDDDTNDKDNKKYNAAHGSTNKLRYKEAQETKSRVAWKNITKLLTFLIPNSLLILCGIKGKDTQIAWREKVAICMLILYLWLLVLFVIIGLGFIMCPIKHVYNIREVGVHNSRDDAYITLHGRVYDVTKYLKISHAQAIGGTTIGEMGKFAGLDVNASFPIPIRSACSSLVTKSIDPNFNMFLKPDDETSVLFPFIHRPGQPIGKMLPDPGFYYNYVLPRLRIYLKGDLVWSKADLDDMHFKHGSYSRIIREEVFNLDAYFRTINAPENQGNLKFKFLSKYVEAIFDDGLMYSTDITRYWDRLPIDQETRLKNYECLKSLFYAGKIDERKSFQCLFSNYLLLSFAFVLMAAILVKFLASLQLTPRRKPQRLNKFVICQVPCYTEGEHSLKLTINSLAGLNYDARYRILFIICDGNIVGSGNDRSTPRIVLDILEVDRRLDSAGYSFYSLGDGSKIFNMAKVHSGLYEFEGNFIPFVVVSKIGMPGEKYKPGNRGKRDSQMILLRFLNRLHFDLPMTPLELEIYHQMKNVIGIHPALYEYILMVDADTQVHSEALNRLVSCMVHDSKKIGICGETQIANEDKNWTTMIQVYEYFISHHMSKAFESLFGSVTCLPGCFSLYRIKTTDGIPIVVSNNVIRDYEENVVDTLHKKNLLSLGEDRYLTTLMIKYFPQYKLSFTSDAKCKTAVPESWDVLLSQRRRWINSTVHNLVELTFLPGLCGTCCFSMRFVVFLDLFGTLTMPCTIIYFGYLVYVAVTKITVIGYVSLLLLAITYGLQSIIFILKRQWQHVGWLIIYMMAYPLWSFFIPIYAFWHFDDFSWGNTRVVVGDDGKKLVLVEDEEKVEYTKIPLRTISEYEEILNEKQTRLQEINNVAKEIENLSQLSLLASRNPIQNVDILSRVSQNRTPVYSDKSYYPMFESTLKKNHASNDTRFQHHKNDTIQNNSERFTSHNMLIHTPASDNANYNCRIDPRKQYGQELRVFSNTSINTATKKYNELGTNKWPVFENSPSTAYFKTLHKNNNDDTPIFNNGRLLFNNQPSVAAQTHSPAYYALPSQINPNFHQSSPEYGFQLDTGPFHSAHTSINMYNTAHSSKLGILNPYPYPYNSMENFVFQEDSALPGKYLSSDREMHDEIKEVLSCTNLAAVPKERIMTLLEEYFNTSMKPYEQFIRSVVDELLRAS